MTDARDGDGGAGTPDPGGSAGRGAPAKGRGLYRRRSHPVRVALLTLGVMLLLIGFVGGLIPVLQGWPFGVAGAVILYLESRWVQRKVRRWRQRHPRAEQTYLRARAWLRERKKKRRAAARAKASPPTS